MNIPPIIDRLMLNHQTALVISVSGGKDSQAMLNLLAAAHRDRHWNGRLFAVHAHLGRAEWPQTMKHCQRICDAVGISLYIVGRTTGADLVDRWRDRMQKLEGTGKPFWSSAKNRYCTSDMKRGPIDQFLRQFKIVISAEGLRADESPARAKKPSIQMREAITAKALHGLDLDDACYYRSFEQRLAITWYPILSYSIDDVWAACGHSREDLQQRQQRYRDGDMSALDGWLAHIAYVLGNERLSCCLCVLASKNDLRNGAIHNPSVYVELVGMEQESGFTFRQDLALADLFTT